MCNLYLFQRKMLISSVVTETKENHCVNTEVSRLISSEYTQIKTVHY